jgi:hypothetical protein
MKMSNYPQSVVQSNGKPASLATPCLNCKDPTGSSKCCEDNFDIPDDFPELSFPVLTELVPAAWIDLSLICEIQQQLEQGDGSILFSFKFPWS